MKSLKILILLFIAFIMFTSKAFAYVSWDNDLLKLLSTNSASIYAINIRTFNAKDTNGDGIIDETEERGSFLNAIDRLDDLATIGINVIQLMPVTPVGKTKALGTAGSLYAASGFDELNPQLKSKNSSLSLKDEMKKFVDECHKRKIRVVVDLPCCGAYDLYLQHPEYFKKDKSQNPIIPSDWTDVRLFDTGSDTQINADVYNLYANFIDLMVDINVDGIRANAAYIKPYTFWKTLIEETKLRNPQLVFLAEASPLDKPIQGAEFTSYNKLLEAGFDSCYGGYSNLKNWQSADDLYSAVKSNLRLQKKFGSNKAFIADFNTQNQISPILVNGTQFSEMMLWLNVTLPINSYYIDGFPTGDDYIYFWTNKKASKSYTDDDYYFTHRGQLDIFNFSRKPQGKRIELFNDFVIANRFKVLVNPTLANGNFVPLRTSSSSVFAYARSANSQSIVVVGNLNFRNIQNVVIHVPKISSDTLLVPIKMQSIPKVDKGKIELKLAPGEVMVLLLSSFEIK